MRMKKLLKRQGMLLLAVFSLLMVFESLAELTHSDYSVFQKVEAKTKKSKKTKAKSDFNPKDSSDTTIESIVTYSDYLDMYEFIINEYITNYETIVKQFDLGDDSSYQEMRKQVTESIEKEKEKYGPMKKSKIIGKSDLVQFLKDYRDNLKDVTDQIAANLQ